MMKSIYTLLIICALMYQMMGQAEPFYEFDVYFEDAMGHRDTIVLGVDWGIDDNYHPKWHYGEDSLTTPFDSVFEVRVTVDDFHLGNPPYASKKFIASAEGQGEYKFSEFATIFMHCKYPPVTMSYDSTIFTVPERVGSFFTPDFAVQVIQEPTDVNIFDCAKDQSQLTFDPNSLDSIFIPIEGSWPVEGHDTLVTLYGRYFKHSYLPYCGRVSASVQQVQEMGVFPNPAMEEIRWRDDIIVDEARVYDLQGRECLSVSSLNGAQLYVGGLSKGVYFMVMEDVEGQRYLTSFVKM